MSDRKTIKVERVIYFDDEDSLNLIDFCSKMLLEYCDTPDAKLCFNWDGIKIVHDRLENDSEYKKRMERARRAKIAAAERKRREYEKAKEKFLSLRKKYEFE